MNRILCTTGLLALLALGACSPAKRSAFHTSRLLFGLLPSADTVYRFQLHNPSGMEVSILNYGGVIQAIRVPDRSDSLRDVVLGFDSLSLYLSKSPFFGALIGRYGNRIARGRFTLDGKTYQLPINDGLNSLHGGDQGFDKKLWKPRYGQTDSTAWLQLDYVSPAGEEGYPGTLRVQVTYTLRSDNSLRIDYLARTDSNTVLNLTNHSYFNLGEAGHTVLPDSLQILASRFLPVDSTLIPTGELREVAGTPMDFRNPQPIGKRIDSPYRQLRLVHGGYDHCFVLDHPGLDRVQVRAWDPRTGIQLEVYTDQPAVQFYTGNFLDGSFQGKQGKVYPKHGAFCLETEHYPDSPNHPDFPSTELKAGKSFRSSTVYRFSVRP